MRPACVSDGYGCFRPKAAHGIRMARQSQRHRDSKKGKRRLHLILNRTQGGHWTGFRLRGAGQNPSAIAARVFLRDGERVQVRQVEGGMGAGGQRSGPVVRFGLGEATEARAIVHWPSGIVQDLGTVKAGKILDATEPAPRRV